MIEKGNGSTLYKIFTRENESHLKKKPAMERPQPSLPRGKNRFGSDPLLQERSILQERITVLTGTIKKSLIHDCGVWAIGCCPMNKPTDQHSIPVARIRHKKKSLKDTS